MLSFAVAALLTKSALPLIPMPNSFRAGTGPGAELSSRSPILGGEGLYAAWDLRASLKGWSGKGQSVRFVKDKTLGHEAYRLTSGAKGVTVTYGDASGALYAVQTLKQYIAVGHTIPAFDISDQPRFGWRGMHLDVSRHVFTVAEVKRLLDQMTRYKFNIFHWHLIDDGGWRIEIKKYPKLTQVGAYRKGNGDWGQNGLEIVPKGPNTYGGFYTQEQIKDVVRYASQRGITVVPEIEMPGHTLPAIIAYPELGCSEAKPYPAVKWVTNVYCAGKESTFTFLQNVLDEVLQLFPSKVIHIGGDEVDSKWWGECPDCQEQMQIQKLKGTEELQSSFIRRIEKYLNSKGRDLMGWDEILMGGLAPNAQVMSWRGISGGIEAAKSGHPVVMTPTSHCYFDYGYDSIDTKKVYLWNPIPDELQGDERKLVRGAQANLWTEWVPNRSTVDKQLWPRALAMSEVLWSNRPKDWNGFEQRLMASYPILDKLGIDYNMEAPPSGFYFSKVSQPYAPKLPRQLYYSLDEKAPASQWKPVGPKFNLPLNKPVFTAYKRASGSIGTQGRLFCSDQYRLGHASGDNGLAVDTWQGEFKYCRDFVNLRRGGSRTATTVSVDARPREHEYALRFRANISFPDNDFKLYLTSDDGSMLKLNGLTVIDNDGAHGAATKEVTVHAALGNYELEVLYYEIGGGQVVKLEYEDLKTGTRREVPADWYFMPEPKLG